MPQKKRRWTERQRRFVAAYLRLGNATKAAIEAGYAPKYADRQGHQLLEKTRELLEEERKKLEKQELIKREQVFRLWAQLMSGVDENGEPVPASVRLKASELAAKALGMFVERREVSVEGGFVVALPEVEEDDAE